MAKTLKDLKQSVQNIFNDDKGIFRQANGRHYIVPSAPIRPLFQAAQSIGNYVNRPFENIGRNVSQIPQYGSTTTQKALNYFPQAMQSIGSNFYKDITPNIPIVKQTGQYLQNRVITPTIGTATSTFNLLNPVNGFNKGQRVMAGVNAGLGALYTAANISNPIGTQAANLPFAGFDAIKRGTQVKLNGGKLGSGLMEGFTGEKVPGLGDIVYPHNPKEAGQLNTAEMLIGLAIPAYHGLRGMLKTIPEKVPASDANLVKGYTRYIKGFDGKFKGSRSKNTPMTYPEWRASQGMSNPSRPQYGYAESRLEIPTNIKVNTNRMGVNPNMKPGIEDLMTTPVMQQKTGSVVGDRLTFNEMKAQAKVSPEMVSTKTREATVKLGAEALALRNKVAELSKLGLDNDQFQEALIRDKAFGTFVARLLGQRRIVSNPADKTLFNTLISQIIKEGHSPEAVARAAKNVDFNNPQQATQFYRQFIKPNVGDWVDKIRYNSMLSSPSTSIVNISGNAQGTAVMEPLKRSVEGEIDALVSAFTGRERTRLAGEGAAYGAGYVKSIKPALKNFIDTFTGKRLIDNPDLRQVPLSTGGTARKVERVLDLPARVNEAFDQLFKTLTQGGIENANKYKSTRGIKITGQASKQAEEALFRGELMKDGEGVISNAIGGGAKWVKQGTFSKNPVVRWTAKLTLPFINIGTNLTKAGVEYNPVLGGINMIGNADKTGQGAKMIIGGAVSALGAMMAMGDKLTFGEPIDQKRKNAFREAGMQPYAMKIGDKWYSYSKMHPAIAFQLATVAALTQAVKDRRISESTAEVIANGAFNGLKFIADQTYFKNVGDFVNTMGGDVEGLARLAANYPGQLIPFRGLASWLERSIDQYQRKPDTSADFLTQTMQQIFTQIPGLAQTVPERLGPSGLPIENQNRLVNAFSPIRVTTENPQAKEYLNLLNENSRLTKVEKDLKSEIETQLSKSDITTTPNVMLSGVDQSYQQSLQDQVQADIFKKKFEMSGQKYAEYGNKIYMNEDGMVKVYTKEDFEKAITDAKYSLTVDRLKRNEDYEGWLRETTNYISYLQDYQSQLDPIADQKTAISLQNKIEDLSAQVEKYSSYGGFKKGKKPKKMGAIKLVSAKAAKPFNLKLSKPKTPKIKLAGNSIKVSKSKQPQKYKIAKTRMKFTKKPTLT